MMRGRQRQTDRQQDREAEKQRKKEGERQREEIETYNQQLDFVNQRGCRKEFVDGREKFPL